MKSLLYIALLMCLSITACKKISTDDVITRTVTPNFPGLTLKGEEVVSTGIGTGTFTDPGATGYDSITNTSTELQPIANTVDLTKTGFYSVQYETKNTYGYRTNKSRLVLITSVPASEDISGTYERTSNGQEVTLTKTGTGLYTIDNIGGVAGDPDFIAPVYIGIPNDTTVSVPTQPGPFGADVSVTEGKLKKTATTITFSYKVSGLYFGTATRTFIKVL